MKTHLLCITALMAWIIPTAADDGIVSQTNEAILSDATTAKTLADACDIVRLINELEWEAAKKRLNDGNQLALIEPISKAKDWHGIGAYRGSEIDREKEQVKHRFSYGSGRIAVHEVWITYSINASGFKKPTFYILGW